MQRIRTQRKIEEEKMIKVVKIKKREKKYKMGKSV
jgi:hypothetical protein